MISLTVEGFEQGRLVDALQAELETSTGKRKTSKLPGEQAEGHEEEVRPDRRNDGGTPTDSSPSLHQRSIRQRRPVAGAVEDEQ